MQMKPVQKIRVLLVEDDEDDYIITSRLLSEIEGKEFELDWASTYHQAVAKAASNHYHIYLIDYLLGERNGIQLARNFFQNGSQTPIILLTGRGSYDVDRKAMKEGIADYLEKSLLSSSLLERAIRYAIDHWNTLAALKESEQKLRILSGKLLEAQENERRAVAQELHDSIGASLTAIRYGLEERLQREDRGNASAQGVSLEQIIGIVQDTTEEVHRISSNLRPSIIDDMGLFTAIRSICRELQNVGDGIRIKTQISVKEHEIPESLGIIIYRILQEALNNVFKHSGADAVYVSLKKNVLFLELQIKDNGKGFDKSEQPEQTRQKQAMGLIGMKDRTELSSGTFEVLSEKGKGTTILATWKLGGAFPVS